jgi:hypothetical protein
LVLFSGEASGNDIRIVEVEKTISFEQLLDKLQAKYHKRLILQFKDTGKKAIFSFGF